MAFTTRIIAPFDLDEGDHVQALTQQVRGSGSRGMSRCEGLAFRALGSPGQALLGRGGVGHALGCPASRAHLREERTFTAGYRSSFLPAGDSKIATSITTPVRGSQVL
jgi:hypothetical protein